MERCAATAHPALLLTSVALMLLPSSWVQPGRNVLLAVVGPVELGMNRLFDGIAELPQRWRISSRLLRENSALSTELQETRSKVWFLEVQLIESQKLINQLRDLKQVLPKTGYALVAAHIVNKRRVHAAGGRSRHSFIIGCGSRDGVRRGDLVVTGYAVVGTVSAVSTGVSTVRLVTHRDFCIAAHTADGVGQVLRGTGNHGCLLAYVGARPAINVGDYVVTSGFEGRHPPGLLLGTVEDLTPTRTRRGLRIEVQPAAKLGQAGQVIVVRRQRRRK